MNWSFLHHSQMTTCYNVFKGMWFGCRVYTSDNGTIYYHAYYVGQLTWGVEYNKRKYRKCHKIRLRRPCRMENCFKSSFRSFWFCEKTMRCVLFVSRLLYNEQSNCTTPVVLPDCLSGVVVTWENCEALFSAAPDEPIIPPLCSLIVTSPPLPNR